MNHWTNGWFFLSGYLSRLFILSVFRSPPDSQPFWSIKQFSCLAAKRYKSFTLLCIMSCIMHWLAVIKTFILLSSYSGWDPSSGVLFNFGCFSRRFCRAQVLHFTFFFLSSHTFHSVSALLLHLLSPPISLLFFPQPPSRRSICFCQTYFVFWPKLSANTCCMPLLTRPCGLGGARHMCRHVDWKKKKKNLSTCACLSHHKYIF